MVNKMNPQLYSYAGGDPINRIDCTGMGVQDQQKLQPQNAESTNDSPFTAPITGGSALGNFFRNNIPLIGGY